MKKILQGLFLIKRGTFLTFLSLALTALPACNLVAQEMNHVFRSATFNLSSFTPSQLYENMGKLYSVNQKVDISHPDFGKVAPGENHLWYEQYSKRTATTRNFITEDGKEIIAYARSPINFRDKHGNYIAIDSRLSPSANGWAALNQPYPTYLNHDGSSEMSLSGNDRMKFNFNNVVAGKNISLNNFTAGDDGMLIHDVIEGVDKRIVYTQNRVETDYILNKPVAGLTSDLVISEEIVLPAGYSIKENKLDEMFGAGTSHAEMVVVNASGVQSARFKMPYCYDSNKDAASKGQSVYFANYQLRENNGKTFLDVVVSSTWLNDPSRVYPVTIDPLVNGPTSFWFGGDQPSCFLPNYDSLELTITIPAFFTVEHFFIQASYYSFNGALIPNGAVHFTTPCSRSPKGGGDYSGNLNQPGYGYIPITGGGIDFDTLALCFTPSCSAQTFPLYYALARNFGGAGCNSSYVYYDDTFTSYPYEAYVQGRKSELTPSSTNGWSISPTSQCGDVCTFTLTANVIGGVPPYTMHHAWDASGTGITFGTHVVGGTSSGTGILTLTIPAANCPAPVCSTATATVAAPTITDACNQTVSVTGTKTLTRNPVPNVTANPTSSSICSGALPGIILTSCVAGSTISWTGSDGNSGSGASGMSISDHPTNITASPITVTYSITVVSGNGCSGSPITVPVTVNPIPVVGASASPSANICAGSAVTLSGTGAAGYTWSGGVTDGVSFVPGGTNTYTVTGTTAGCSNTATITVTVATGPPVGINASPSNTVCAGTPVTLSGTGATGYTWTGGIVNGVAFVPVGINTYTVTGTTAGCTGTATITVTATALPPVGAAASPSTTVCTGNSVTLNGTGATGYTWTGGVNNGVSFIPPAGATTYTVTGTASGCSATATITITVTGLPTVIPNASPSATVCAGSSVTLTGSGATSYTWTGGVTDGVPFVPVGTNTYTVTGTLAGCGSNTATITITANAIPPVGSSATPSNTVCAGSPVTLSGTGAAGYTWTGGVNNGVSFVPSVGTTTYTVTGTTAGCSATSTITVTLNAIPTVGATASPSNIVCAGTLVTLSGTGAAGYTWTGSVVNGVAFVPPVGNNTYTVTGTTAGCSNTSTITIAVTALPTVGVTVSPSNTVCTGVQVTLSGTGAAGYTWTGGVVNGVAFLPPGPAPTSTTYTVTGTTAGCSNTSTITITVTNVPTVGATASPSNTVCAGSPVTLNGTGATSYTWTNGVTDGVPFVPVGINTYTVTGSVPGCGSNTSTITVTATPLPPVGATASPSNAICAGASVTLNGTGAVGYTWTGGVVNGVAFVPPGTNTYTVTGTVGACSNTATSTITIIPPFTVNASSPASTVCPGDSAQINAIGAPGGSHFVWTNPGTVTCDTCASTYVHPPNGTTSYVVTATSPAGCTATNAVNITATALVATISPNTSVCSGHPVPLQAGGGTTYVWGPSTYFTNPGDSTIATPIARPTETITYSVTVSSGGSCTAIKTVTISVYAKLIAPTISKVNDTTLACTRNAMYTSYQWYNGSAPIPGATDTFCIVKRGGGYSVNVQDANGCSITAGINIDVGVPNFSSDHSIYIFPNPANDELNIVASKIHDGEAIEISVMDILGKSIRQEKIYWNSAMKLDIRNPASGIYFLQIQQPQVSWIGRFVKE